MYVGSIIEELVRPILVGRAIARTCDTPPLLQQRCAEYCGGTEQAFWNCLHLGSPRSLSLSAAQILLRDPVRGEAGSTGASKPFWNCLHSAYSAVPLSSTATEMGLTL